ncbi:hypothetical protein GCM10012288_21570 [Malaciobacter pacificus]|uniref:Uncharacterized protein n=1 Tax=Malaciobacter pacificus TaxID=1080223 RepID=A0A5C2HAC6_9BACT|nr:hypothetical protein [Malaciobacter pacificus]QEP34116.1 hypothetical protein APAC_0988 [Malaciobacter pacificus]GGD47018.1 hypothetical protein GCM10012288_21570 [Malaciobacter pacificus]
MQVNNSVNQALNLFKQNDSSTNESKTSKESVENLEDTFNESAVKVSLSMNAQVILFSMNTASSMKENTIAQGAASFKISDEQQEVLDFLSGKSVNDGEMSLENIGYEGKPILELTPQEAQDLVSEDGFFGVEQTSNRVANFVFSFAGDDLELLQKGKEGIIQGFQEAEKLFGGKLPEISYETQNRTLALLDEKISSLGGDISQES